MLWDSVLLSNSVVEVLHVEHTRKWALGVVAWEVWIILVFSAVFALVQGEFISYWHHKHYDWLRWQVLHFLNEIAESFLVLCVRELWVEGIYVTEGDHDDVGEGFCQLQETTILLVEA